MEISNGVKESFIKQKIQKDLKVSLKEGKTFEVSVLRMVLASIKNKEIEKKKKEEGLSDEEIISVLQSEIKKRKEALELYKKGKRLELAKIEEEERKFLEKYLPKQLSEEELRLKVKEIIEKLGASNPQDLGKVMSVLMGEIKGRADGALVNKIVQEELKKISQ